MSNATTNLPKRQPGFEFSTLSKVTIGEGEDAVTTRACVATYYDERVGTIVRGTSGIYFVSANHEGEGEDAEPVGMLAELHGTSLTTRKGTSYDALVRLIREGDGFPENEAENTDEDGEGEAESANGNDG